MSTIIVHAKAALPGKSHKSIDDATMVAADGMIHEIGPRRMVALPAGPDRVYNFDDHLSTLRRPAAVFQAGRLVAREGALCENTGDTDPDRWNRTGGEVLR